MDPRKIKLEITERVLNEGQRVLSTIDQTAADGYSFSMDDFGTGYSSFNSLFNMQVSTIKIDRSFVSNINTDLRSRAIVQAVIAMAIGLGVDVIAEGIENENQAKLLVDLGCQYGQGFLYAKPKSLEQILTELLSGRKAA